MQIVYWNRAAQQVSAASDPRGVGAAQVLAAASPKQQPFDSTAEDN
jgi:hypothetical protein